jgi:hypothetical protein
VIEFARKRAALTEASWAESWSPEWAEAGEDPPDASTAGGADKRRRGGDAGEGAVVGVSAGLARLGDCEATVGEAMPAGAGKAGSRRRPRGAGGGPASRREVRGTGRRGWSED